MVVEDNDDVDDDNFGPETSQMNDFIADFLRKCNFVLSFPRKQLHLPSVSELVLDGFGVRVDLQRVALGQEKVKQ